MSHSDNKSEQKNTNIDKNNHRHRTAKVFAHCFNKQFKQQLAYIFFFKNEKKKKGKKSYEYQT